MLTVRRLTRVSTTAWGVVMSVLKRARFQSKFKDQCGLKGTSTPSCQAGPQLRLFMLTGKLGESKCWVEVLVCAMPAPT